MREADWNDPRTAALAIALAGSEQSSVAILVLVNGGAEAVAFRLPAAGDGRRWTLVADTADPAAVGAPAGAESRPVAARSLAVLEQA